MKHKIITFFVLCFFMLSVSITAFASAPTDQRKTDAQFALAEQIDEVNSTLSALSSDPAYGGIYYEGDKLIINVVNSKSASSQQIQSSLLAYPDIDIEYRYVTYSLDFLESVKETLSSHMGIWNISALDANEVTNQVDVYLKYYNNQVKADITKFIDDIYGVSDFLNFVNHSNVSIKDTVANIADFDSVPFDNRAIDFDGKNSGDLILIGSSSVYTLGPIFDSLIAYSAGHGNSGGTQQSVYNFSPNMKHIGVVTGHFGGSDGDWGEIHACNGHAFNIMQSCSFQTTATGRTVYMHGGKTGITSGKVTGTNITVLFPPYKPLTGMYSATYVCYPGDSGAGIFSTSNLSTYPPVAYGIQSSALFYEDNGEWAGTSYFTPSNKLFQTPISPLN